MVISIGQNCPDSIELIHNDTICPGQVGVLQCTLTNSIQVDWNVDGIFLVFSSGDIVGDSVTRSGTIAYLVARTPEGRLWNWTSVVFYTPGPSVRGSVSVLCGGGGASDCTKHILVIGELLPYFACTVL